MHETDVIHFVQEGDVDELRAYFGTVERMCQWKFTKTGDTLAILACRYGNTALLRDLTSYESSDAKWDAPNCEAKLPLHEAAQQGNEECVRLLLSTGKVNVNALKRGEWTPLHLACTKECNVEVCRLLLGAGASISMRNKDGWNALHIAARDSTCDVLLLLLQHEPQCLATRSRNGRTPLHTCALNGCHENLLCLLSLRSPAADFSQPQVDALDSCGSSPLADAVRGDHVGIAELLLQHGASLATRDHLGRSLLHVAAETGSLNAIRWLLKFTSDVSFSPPPFGVNEPCAAPLGMTPLHFAAREGHQELLQLLLDQGGDMNACDAKGRPVYDYVSNSR